MDCCPWQCREIHFPQMSICLQTAKTVKRLMLFSTPYYPDIRKWEVWIELFFLNFSKLFTISVARSGKSNINRFVPITFLWFQHSCTICLSAYHVYHLIPYRPEVRFRYLRGWYLYKFSTPSSLASVGRVQTLFIDQTCILYKYCLSFLFSLQYLCHITFINNHFILIKFTNYQLCWHHQKQPTTPQPIFQHQPFNPSSPVRSRPVPQFSLFPWTQHQILNQHLQFVTDLWMN